MSNLPPPPSSPLPPSPTRASIFNTPASFLGGVGVEIFGMGWNLAMQEHIEDHLLSRAYSYDALGSFVAIPIGQVLYGPLGEAFGFERVMVASGLVYAVVVALVLCSRSVRTLPRAPFQPDEPKLQTT